MRYSADVRGVIDSPITQSREWAASWKGSEPLIDVSQAAPGYPPAQELRSHLAERVQEPVTATYTDQLGMKDLREVLAGRLASEYAASVEPSQVAITAGCNQAFCVALTALATRGDEVILPVPYYFNHDMWLRLNGVVPRYLTCGQDMMPEVERAAELINAKTRAIVLVTPNNPTGALYPPETTKAFYHLAEKHGIALLIDETYRDFRTEEGPPHTLLGEQGWPHTLVQLYSFSKAYCLAGYRVGAITASEELLREIAKIIDCVAICPTHLSQRAALFALQRLNAWKTAKAEKIGRRIALFRDLMTETDGPFSVVSSGAYFAYVAHPYPSTAATEVARRLAGERGILCLPGNLFGPGQDAYLRLAFANLDSPGIETLVERLNR